ncbi:MAG: hypothetical protein IPL70_09865 [Uliginosibacterium sp.]|nr:hypothetical protein [Uliginosibacterium sp.]
MITTLVFALTTALVALNSYATLRVLRSVLFKDGQKAAQVVLIWVVPLLGALLVLRVATDEPMIHKEHFEQVEHTDRIGINGEPTPWSGHHDRRHSLRAQPGGESITTQARLGVTMINAARATCFVIVLVICSLPLPLFMQSGEQRCRTCRSSLLLCVLSESFWARGGQIGFTYLVSVLACMTYGFGSIFYGSEALNRPIVTNALYFSIPVSLVVSIVAFELFQRDRSASHENEPKNEDQSKNSP